MRNDKSKYIRGSILLAVLIMLVAFGASGNRTSAASEPAEQVIFSGVGLADDGDWVSPVGFWIWCAAEGEGPYADNHVCSGAIYVYAQGLTKGVHGFAEENPDDSYTMTVFANDGSNFSAELTNEVPVSKGPRNTVSFSVTTNAGTSSGASHNSVVNVTGPGD